MLKVDIDTLFWNKTGINPLKKESELYHFHFAMEPKKINALMGPTGIGKTTLFFLLAGLIHSSGSIQWEEKEINTLPPAKRPILLFFQEQNLFFHLNIKTNILLNLDPKKNPGLMDALDDLFTKTNLTSVFNRFPDQLSGGQKQLVTLVRLLLRARFHSFPHFQHAIFLLDEPFNGLDEESQQMIQSLLKIEMEKLGFLLLYTSHDVALVRSFSEKVWAMQRAKPVEVQKIEGLYGPLPSRKIITILPKEKNSL